MAERTLFFRTYSSATVYLIGTSKLQTQTCICGTTFPFVFVLCVCAEVFEVFQEHKLVINEHN